MNILLIIGTSLILLYGVLTECKLKFEDVSTLPEYSTLVKDPYSLKTEMYICGVNLPPGYGSDINIYTIHPVKDGRIKGREIISEDVLKPGTVLEIQSIEKSVNHLPGCQSIDAVVSVISYEKAVNVPIKIDLRYLQSTNYVSNLE